MYVSRVCENLGEVLCFQGGRIIGMRVCIHGYLAVSFGQILFAGLKVEAYLWKVEARD